MVRSAGFEPTAYGLGIRRSILLSYDRSYPNLVEKGMIIQYFSIERAMLVEY